MLTIFFSSTKNLRTYYTKPKKSKLFKPLNKNFISNLSHKSLKLFEDHYLDDSVRDNISSVAGYIPYVKNQTKIYFYHFFSVNYGVRKTFTGQLSIIDDSNSVIKSIVITFPSRFNGVIDLSKIFNNLEGESCIFELYHKRIPVNHAGHQGHLRFWGIYGKDSSTVHSMLSSFLCEK